MASEAHNPPPLPARAHGGRSHEGGVEGTESPPRSAHSEQSGPRQGGVKGRSPWERSDLPNHAHNPAGPNLGGAPGSEATCQIIHISPLVTDRAKRPARRGLQIA